MEQPEKRDWAAWHRSYDDPASALSQRLGVVQEQLRRALDERPGPVRIISMCAGEGRDIIGVLAEARRTDVAARLVELDERNATAARQAALAGGLERVEVVCADAAATDSYVGAVPADIVLACGVFGNISEDDIQRTIAHLPQLCAAGATVIWTRGMWQNSDAPSRIRGWFEERGFEEIAFVAPDDHPFRVGAHRLISAPMPLERGLSMFTFLR